MSNIQIPNLGAVVALNGSEQVEVVQAGESRRASALQIANLFSGSVVLTLQSPDSSLTITPNIGNVQASINTAHANVWSGQQTFIAPNLGIPASGDLSNCNNLPIMGGTTGNLAPSRLNFGVNANGLTFWRGDGTWAVPFTNPGTVSSVGVSFNSGIVSVVGSPITTSGVIALNVAGTSGGVPYFSSASSWASSALLASNQLMIGGGAGNPPATTTTVTGMLNFLGQGTSISLALAMTDETGTGSLVFGTNPTITAPTITNPVITGATISTSTFSNGSITGSIAGNPTFSNSPIFTTPVLGTPSSGNLVNCTGYSITNVAGMAVGMVNFLQVPSSGNLRSTVTDETGTGLLVFNNAPTLTNVNITGGTISGVAIGGISLASPVFTGTVQFPDGSTWGTTGPIVVATSKVGIGMTPVNILDIKQDVNTQAGIVITNPNAGTSAYSLVAAYSLTGSLSMVQWGTNWTTSSVNRKDGSLIQSVGAGGLTFHTAGAPREIYFAQNTVEIARFDVKGNLGLGRAPPAQDAQFTGFYLGERAWLGSTTGFTGLFITSNTYQNASSQSIITANGPSTMLVMGGNTLDVYGLTGGIAGAVANYNLQMSIAANGDTTFSGSVISKNIPAPNIIINGDISVNQRGGTGGNITTSLHDGYPADRWHAQISPASCPPSWAANVLQWPGSSDYPWMMVWECLVGAVPVDPACFAFIEYVVEANDFGTAMWGTPAAKPVTFSFNVTGPAGTYGVAFRSLSSPARSYVSSFTIVPGPFQKISITIPGDSGGTSASWPRSGTAGALSICFDTGTSTTYSTSTINTWLGGNYVGLLGGFKIMNVTGQTLYITNIKLEIGNVATPFVADTYEVNLAKCMRYFQKYAGNSIYERLCTGFAVSALQGEFWFPLRVRMRVIPSFAGSILAITDGQAGFGATGYSLVGSTESNIMPTLNVGCVGPLVIRSPLVLCASGSTDAVCWFNAEF